MHAGTHGGFGGGPATVNRAENTDRIPRTGHAAVGHLRINISEIVQGDQIVLEGVERPEASALAQPLRRAIDAANHTVRAEPSPARNVSRREATQSRSNFPSDEW
jgi:hypothetical protein